MPRINLYAQNRHTLVIDGVSISGFGEGDFMTIKLDGNAASRSMGADGPSMSISAPGGASIKVSLQPTSPVIGTLYALRTQQRENPRLFNMVLVSGVDELINAGRCAFGDLSQFSTGGDKMQPREFNIEALDFIMDESNPGPIV